MNSLNKKILDILIPRLDPYLIVIFGSVAQDRSRDESDLDIGFLSELSMGTYELFTIGQQLANKINQDVDLIDLKNASTVFQAQIVHTGEVIYCADEKKWLEFQVKVLKMYARLNEDRKEVIDSIKESGTIYGK